MKAAKEWATDFLIALVITTPIWLSCRYFGVARTFLFLLRLFSDN